VFNAIGIALAIELGVPNITHWCLSLAGCLSTFTSACAVGSDDETEPTNDGLTPEDGSAPDAVVSPEIAPQTLLFDKKSWGTAGTTYDHDFFVSASKDTAVAGSRVVKTDPTDGRTYQQQTITSSTGWGDLSVIHAQIAAHPGEWWKNEIHGKVGSGATSDIFVEGKIYFHDSGGKVLWECVSVTQSTSWAAGNLEVWPKNPAPKDAEINIANSSCKAPPNTVSVGLHIKTTAKSKGQHGAGMVDEWRVGRCDDSGKCDLM